MCVYDYFCLYVYLFIYFRNYTFVNVFLFEELHVSVLILPFKIGFNNTILINVEMYMPIRFIINKNVCYISNILFKHCNKGSILYTLIIIKLTHWIWVVLRLKLGFTSTIVFVQLFWAGCVSQKHRYTADLYWYRRNLPQLLSGNDVASLCVLPSSGGDPEYVHLAGEIWRS